MNKSQYDEILSCVTVSPKGRYVKREFDLEKVDLEIHDKIHVCKAAFILLDVATKLSEFRMITGININKKLHSRNRLLTRPQMVIQLLDFKTGITKTCV